MVAAIQRFIAKPLYALCALPLLWQSPADAASLSCTLSAQSGGGLSAFNQQMYSVQCDGEGLSVTGQGRRTSDGTGIQVRLRFQTNVAVPHAVAFGYDANGTFIPGCVADDTTTGTSFVTTTCNSPTGAVSLVVLSVTAN